MRTECFLQLNKTDRRVLFDLHTVTNFCKRSIVRSIPLATTHSGIRVPLCAATSRNLA